MAYTVLARRYRSNAFDQVVGQEHVARTLTNAIATGRVAHAYLFCGTRGVGKTSMARLFARALNAPATIPDCPTLPGETDYPPADAQQRMADAVMRGDDLNVIEIDGASNNSVENARNLIANASLVPTNLALHKIYIIDEVHMLSTAAFNALLKTMEEPPPHVKFILCTTEAHKVPATIQSRCQRFDFRNIPTPRIAAHLTDVLSREDIEADEQVVWELARLGNGSMRDALSLLDRLIATGQSPLSGDILERMLGLPAAERTVSLVEAIASGDVAGTLTKTAELLRQGIAQDQLFDVLIERFRQLMFLSACGPESDLVELPEEAKKEAAQQAARFDAAGLAHMIAICESVQRMGKSSSNPRALLDAAMVRLALAEKMADVTALLTGESRKKKAGSDRQVLDRRPSPGPRPEPTFTPNRAQPQTPAPTWIEDPSYPGARQGQVQHEPSTTPPKQRTPLAPSDHTNPQAVWAAVLAAAADRPPLAWVRRLALTNIDSRSAVFAPGQGSTDSARFVTDRQRQQLGELVAAVIGQPIRIELQTAPASRPESQSANDTSGSSQRRDIQQEAMALPLVKKVMETFDNVMLVDITREVDRSDVKVPTDEPPLPGDGEDHLPDNSQKSLANDA